jgi:uncharacterized spore protein YtfJ
MLATAPATGFLGVVIDPGAWGAGFGTIVLIVLSAGLGFLAGRRALRKRGDSEAPVGSTVGATLGLLAFMLAFTFGMAAAKHEARRRLVLDEANAIATTVLRGELLSEERAAAVHALLTEYVDVRLAVARDPSLLATALARTAVLQSELWAIARDAARAGPTSSTSHFVGAVNEVLDLHTERMTIGVRDRIPRAIWLALYLLTFLSMAAVGYHAGMGGTARLTPLAMLVLAFASVVLLIADLDHPQQGFMVVSQAPLEDLARELHAGDQAGR